MAMTRAEGPSHPWGVPTQKEAGRPLAGPFESIFGSERAVCYSMTESAWRGQSRTASRAFVS